MGLIEILWAVAAALVPLLLGTAWAMLGLNPPEFWIARACVSFAAFIFIGVSIIWVVLMGWPAIGRVIIAAVLGALSLVIFSEAFRLINARENAIIAQASAAIDKRAALREKLQECYVNVGPIITRSLPKDISTADFDKYVSEADVWATSCASWIEENMGIPARERFLDRTGMTAGTYNGAVNERHNLIMQNLTRFRQNLLVLIESGAWDKR